MTDDSFESKIEKLEAKLSESITAIHAREKKLGISQTNFEQTDQDRSSITNYCRDVA